MQRRKGRCGQQSGRSGHAAIGPWNSPAAACTLFGALRAELALRGPSEQSIEPFVPPSYPPEAQRRGSTGRVELELIFESGSPTYRVGRMWFNGKEQPNRRNDLVAAAARAAEHQKVRSPPPELLVECVEYVFTLDPGPALPSGEKTCKDTHVPGFSPPRLLTDATAARF